MVDDSYKQILTPANIVTSIRIALIPIFVVVFLAPWPSWFPDVSLRHTLEFFKPWIAAAIFALLAFTDSMDGYLARSRNEVTTLGKFLDPLADKILVAAALLALVELNELPAWVVLIIIAREFLVSGLRMVVSADGHVIAASPLGKVKTVTQVIAVICFIVKSNQNLAAAIGDYYDLLNLGAWLVMGVALLLTLLSMVDYFYKAGEALGIPLIKDKHAPKQLDAVPLAHEIIAEAQSLDLTIGTAESCTGGLVAKSITDVSGSSAVFKGGIISYANEVKENSLGVSGQSLETFGAVSEEVALEMACGAIAALDVDIAVSTTGIAGPDGGSEEKPVGTVWIGLAYRSAEHNTTEASAECYTFSGSRAQIRTQAATMALRLAYEHVMNKEEQEEARESDPH